MNLVSVIIPYFRKKKYIEQALNSAIDQTYKNIEIIIIYDDPYKNDIDFIKNLVNKDHRIKLIVNESNAGAGESRNIGIKNSLGNYIAFLDSDDFWDKEKIENQMNFMIQNEYLCSHTSYKVINHRNEILVTRKARNFNNFNSLIKSCDIGLSTAMINKEIFSEKIKFPKIKTKEDFVFWLEILKQNIKIGGLDKELTFWRKIQNNAPTELHFKEQHIINQIANILNVEHKDLIKSKLEIKKYL